MIDTFYIFNLCWHSLHSFDRYVSASGTFKTTVESAQVGGISSTAHLNFIKIAVMLSVPSPSPISSGQISSSMLSTGGHILSSLGLRLVCKSLSFLTHYSFDKQSHMPSQATIMNWSFSCRCLTDTSGNGLTACCSGGKFVLSLYWWSPRALLSANSPSTLSSFTKCPACYIRYLSFCSVGLWSSLRPMAVPLLQRTARLSPELAHKICSLVMKTTQAVVPASIAYDLLFNSLSSSSMVSMSAC